MAGGSLNTKLSKGLLNQVHKIIEGMKKVPPNSNIWNIEMKMTCKLDSKFDRVYSPQIVSVRILQDFINNLTDKIICTLDLLTEDALDLYHHRNELFCELTFTRFNPVAKLKYDEPPELKRSYRCLLLDQEEMFKKISNEDLYPDKKAQMDHHHKSLTIRVELISQTVYDARKKRINEVVRNTFMLDMIRYCINKCGFIKAHIAPPDNESMYINFIIPPGMEARNIMSYLQTGDGMGVYTDGFCSYITSDDIWFVFPRFGEPLSKNITNIYSLGKTNYFGLPRADWKEGEVRHVLINGEVDEKNWNSVGSENEYNAANIALSGCFIDETRKICEDDKCKMFPMIFNEAAVPVDAIEEEETVNLKFVHSRGNIYKILSDIGAFRVTTIDCKWDNPIPFAILPRCLVNFIYDSRNGIKTMPCMAERVDSMFTRSEKIREYPVFTGVSHLTLMSRNKKARGADCY